MSFELTNTIARVTSYNSRSETHGKDEVPACDIRFEIKVPNTALSFFGSQLRDSFYGAAPAHEAPAQDGLDGIDPIVSDKPNLRNPILGGPFEVGYEDMDIATEIAWQNWQAAWNAAMTEAARMDTSDEVLLILENAE